MNEKEVSEKKEKIRNWLKDKHNFIFLGIFILAIVIRLYYFFLTKNQPLWWDEADYLAYAKNLAGIGNTQWAVTPQHNSIFPFIIAGLFKIGLSEAAAKFIVEFIPSILIVYLIYKICLLMYEDKRIAVISSFLMATFWVILFNSMRFHLGTPALFFALLSIHVFFQGYEKKQKIFGKIPSRYAIPLTVVLVILTYSIRRGFFMFGLFFLFYMILTGKFRELIKDKYNWIGGGIAVGLFFITEKLIFTSPIVQTAGTYYHGENPITLVHFGVFSSFFKTSGNILLSPLFVLFYLGLLIIMINLFLGRGYFKKSGGNKIKSDLFVFLMLAITISYFIFFQRGLTAGEPRWYLPLLLGSFICISKAALSATRMIKKYNQNIAVAVLVILICYGGYSQARYAGSLINLKKNSYAGVRDSALYLKEISGENDTIISVAMPQPAYYSERKVIAPKVLLNKQKNEDTTFQEFLSALDKNRDIRFILVSFWEPNHPEWMKKEIYSKGYSGQARLSGWQIPFMETSVNFITGKQDIKQEKKYGNINFRLLKIADRVFIYEISHAEK